MSFLELRSDSVGTNLHSLHRLLTKLLFHMAITISFIATLRYCEQYSYFPSSDEHLVKVLQMKSCIKQVILMHLYFN